MDICWVWDLILLNTSFAREAQVKSRGEERQKLDEEEEMHPPPRFDMHLPPRVEWNWMKVRGRLNGVILSVSLPLLVVAELLCGCRIIPLKTHWVQCRLLKVGSKKHSAVYNHLNPASLFLFPKQCFSRKHIHPQPRHESFPFEFNTLFIWQKM